MQDCENKKRIPTNMNTDYDRLNQTQINIILADSNDLHANTTHDKDATYEHDTTYEKDNTTEQADDTLSTFSSSTVRGKWGKEIEFLFSCIALSVGLGNVWRFPFIALDNGGGAFVIPYIIVLLLIGRPIYYMEVIMGQFASRGCIKAFDMVPIMKGIAYGQVYATYLATTYYACIMAITIKYLVVSFGDILPWVFCRPEWGSGCVATAEMSLSNETVVKRTSSAELFFTNEVLHEKENIDDGIGAPNLQLVLSLLVVWIIIGSTLLRGVHSTGKALYFLALFPYVIMFILLVRAVSLPGSMDGIIYFLKPQWDKLLNAKVWYAAITQMFFSLAICFGTLVMYASYNNFRKTVYRDVIIVTTIDSCTSILAGCIIFGILGNLAYETNAKDVAHVVKGGAGLAFISYPEAIAKFKYLPQVFAVLFFLMLLVLGIGCNIGMASCVITVIKDRFTHLPHWLLASCVTVVSFLCGMVYLTPGGQFILNLVDFYGCSFIIIVLAIAELISVGWFYGVKRFCSDIEFMFNIKTGIYWRICWAVITPGLMFLVLVYTLINYKPLEYKNIMYPDRVYHIGWLIWAIGVGQLPLWAIITVYRTPGATLRAKIKKAMKPKETWGPAKSCIYEEYVLHRKQQEKNRGTIWEKIYDNIFG